MKEIFKNETKCSKKEYNMFIKAHEKEYGLSEDLYTIIYAIFFIWFIIYAFINHIYFIGITIITVLIIFLGYRIIHPNLVVKKEMKSKKVKQEYKNTYNFYKYSFTVKNKEGEARIFYIKINRVLENDTHFYIYLTKKRAFVVSKSGFIKGESRDFAKFLRKRTFFKYRNRCKNN